MRLLPIAIFALALAGCTSVGTLTTSFDPNAAAFINQKGKATVTGQAFLRRNDGVVVYAAGSEVTLIPQTYYSRERMVQIYGSGHFSAFGKSFKNDDPQYLAYTRHTVADGEGKFTFDQVADGSYYITTTVVWMAGYYRQGGALMALAEVKGGQPTNVIMTGE